MDWSHYHRGGHIIVLNGSGLLVFSAYCWSFSFFVVFHINDARVVCVYSLARDHYRRIFVYRVDLLYCGDVLGQTGCGRDAVRDPCSILGHQQRYRSSSRRVSSASRWPVWE